MHEYETGAVREEKDGKGRMDLLPMCALIRLSKHYEKGSVDHGERNWEKGLPMHSFIDSALRHIAKYMDGQTDEDHLCAAAWNILGAMWTEEKRPDMQDIPSRLPRELPLASADREVLIPPVEVERNGDPTESTGEGICKYYKDMSGSPRCSATKSMQSCYCKGNTDDCTHYPGMWGDTRV